MNNTFHLEPETRIGNYSVLKEIERSDYDSIYVVMEIHEQKKYSMKIEKKTEEKTPLKNDIRFMKEFKGSPYFPVFIMSSTTDEYEYSITELMGPSLASLQSITPQHRLSRFTVVFSGLEIFKCIRLIHSIGLAHRNVSPHNILIRNDSRHPLTLASFQQAVRIHPQPLASKNPQITLSLNSQSPSVNTTNQQVDQGNSEELNSIPPSTSQPQIIQNSDKNDQNQFQDQQKEQCIIREDLFSWLFTIITLNEGKLQWNKITSFQELLQNQSEFEPSFQNLPSQYFDIFKSIQNLDQPIDYPGIEAQLEQALKTEPNELIDWKCYDVSSISEITFSREPTRLPSVMLPELSDEESEMAQHEEYPSMYKGRHASLYLGGNEDVVPEPSCCHLL